MQTRGFRDLFGGLDRPSSPQMHLESGDYQTLEQEAPLPARRQSVLVSSGLFQRAPDDRSGTLCAAARKLDRSLGWLPAWHLSIVLDYDRRERVEYEGGPTRILPGAFGPIVVHKSTFPPRPSRGVVFVGYVFRQDLLAWEQILDAEVERL